MAKNVARPSEVFNLGTHLITLWTTFKSFYTLPVKVDMIFSPVLLSRPYFSLVFYHLTSTEFMHSLASIILAIWPKKCLDRLKCPTLERIWLYCGQRLNDFILCELKFSQSEFHNFLFYSLTTIFLFVNFL